MKAKRILAALLAAVLILSLAACGSDAHKSPDIKPYVYWLNFKPELDATLQQLASEYSKSKKIDVKVVTPESADYYSTLSKELESDAPPTMFVIGNSNSAQTFGKYAMDLKDAAITKELSSDNYKLYDKSGKLVSLGYCYECFGIIVNPDLLELAGYKVKDINNFESLKKAVEYIHNNASWMGFDAFSSCDMDAKNAWRFTAHMANLEYFYDERDEGGWDECPSSIRGRYMENYRNLYDLCVNNCYSKPDTLAQGGHYPFNEFKLHETAFCLGGSWDYAEVAESVPNAVMIPYYCGMEGEEMAALCCGTENYWAINDNINDASKKATNDFMVWLVTNDKASAALVEQLGVMPYKSVPASENGFLKDASGYNSYKYYTMDWAFSQQPNSEVYREAVRKALVKYNSDQTDSNWEEVRKAFVDGWAEQYAAVNG